MIYQVFADSSLPAVQLAADELVKYGKGAFARTEVPENAHVVLHPDCSDNFQDSFTLKSFDGKLRISGSNGRSVLYGVYKYLKCFGFDFLYPGEEGEILPENPAFTVDGFDLSEKADRLFRGLSLRPSYPKDNPEKFGASIEEAKALISFMAKNQYNIYFMEGYDEVRPGDRYSVIDGNHPIQHVEFRLTDRTWEERAMVARTQYEAVKEARRHGLLIERGGHGWNYGVPEHYAVNHHISVEEAREILRAKGKINPTAIVATSTWFQICLGKEEVREIYADHIISYLMEHRGEMDIASIWMGDGFDNKCQCDECLKVPFSDLYLDIFRRVALKAKKVLPELILECLIYFESLEPPTRNWLEGLDNVILNLAVWDQCFFHHLDDPECRLPDWVPDYRHNRTHDMDHGKRIINVDQYIPYEGWRKVVGNDIKCFVYNDITFMRYSSRRHFMSYDVRPLLEYSLDDYERFHINGMIDCQCHTSWDKPANLMLYGAGRALWNKNDNDPKVIRKELFEKLYGEKAPQ
ncbi:MAG: DUF4838 domain-containing protein, partial [Lentisphaeria bacterium]|nr:DUF4838 domain-containing protein [Lentisphaeria bacterium]